MVSRGQGRVEHEYSEFYPIESFRLPIDCANAEFPATLSWFR